MNSASAGATGGNDDYFRIGVIQLQEHLCEAGHYEGHTPGNQTLMRHTVACHPHSSGFALRVACW